MTSFSDPPPPAAACARGFPRRTVRAAGRAWLVNARFAAPWGARLSASRSALARGRASAASRAVDTESCARRAAGRSRPAARGSGRLVAAVAASASWQVCLHAQKSSRSVDVGGPLHSGVNAELLVRAVAERLLLGLAARAPRNSSRPPHFDRDGRRACCTVGPWFKSALKLRQRRDRVSVAGNPRSGLQLGQRHPAFAQAWRCQATRLPPSAARPRRRPWRVRARAGCSSGAR